MFPPYAIVAVAPIVGLAGYCVAHVLASHAWRTRGNYPALLAGCAFGFVTMLVASAIGLSFMRDSAIDCLALIGMNAIEYLALAFGYFNFINLNIASLRIRMLQELAEAGGEMPGETLRGLYSTETVIGLRIDRLVHGGHLVERQERYHSGKRTFLFVGRVFDFLRLVILGRRNSRNVSSTRRGREQMHQGTP